MLDFLEEEVGKFFSGVLFGMNGAGLVLDCVF